MVYFSVQLICLIIVLFGNFICGILPSILVRACYKADRDECKRNRILTFLTYFGGGAFMSICFLRLQPKANKEYEIYHHHQLNNYQRLTTDQSDEEGHHEGFPIPEFIILCGFFLIFAIEELFLSIVVGLKKKDSNGRRKIPFCSCAKRHTECSRTFKAKDPTEQTLYGLGKHLNESEREAAAEYSVVRNPSGITADTERRLLQSSIISQPVPNYGAVVNITQLHGNEHSPILPPPIVLDEDGKVTIVQPSQHHIDYRSFTTHLFLSILLAIYNFLQGLSIGGLRDSLSWMHLFQFANQFVLTFVIGSVISQDTDIMLTIICYIALLSTMCPLGISATMIFANISSNISHLFKATLTATLCGGFLYLTFFELLRGNTLHNVSSLGKFIFFTIGAAVIAVIEYISVIT